MSSWAVGYEYFECNITVISIDAPGLCGLHRVPLVSNMDALSGDRKNRKQDVYMTGIFLGVRERKYRGLGG